ncbi:DUF58 domain-containing protein [Halobaculum rarum]|uniref:DUF58 domain-containing protein n=1 Tax=Halobaculum rarum TaxID=3075122 RepID=UPI0032AEFFEC
MRLLDSLRRAVGRAGSAAGDGGERTDGNVEPSTATDGGTPADGEMPASGGIPADGRTAADGRAVTNRTATADDSAATNGHDTDEAFVSTVDGGLDTDPNTDDPASTDGVAGANAAATADDGTTRSTGRWRGIVGVALLAVAAGVLAKRPSLLLVGAVAVVFAAYPLVTTPPDPDLSVSRTIDPSSPDDGDPVTVRTTVRNEGDRTVFDLRIVDGTPPMLPVCGGSPRAATTLRPGDEATLEYELRARPGRHRFQPTTLLCRDVSGSVEVETAVAARTTIECAARLPTVPLRARSRHRTGPLVTDEGGSGLEFHSVTEYERGDPASRIDWRRFARTGELTSVAFRTERLADVVVCVDVRPAAFRASDATEPHAVAHAVDAADRIGDALLEANHRVGLAAIGRDGSLLAPGSGPEHADRFRNLLVTGPAFSLTPPASARADGDGGSDSFDRAERGDPTDGSNSLDEEGSPDETDSLDGQLSRLRTVIGSNTQVILLTPLCDEEAHRIARRLEGEGAAVTVVSPDVTTDRTAGGRLARMERDHRLTDLRNAGVPAVDWDPTESLGAALSAIERWER